MRAILSTVTQPSVRVAAGLALLVAGASPALAQQGGSPLGGCTKSSYLDFTGGAEGSSRAGRVSGGVQFECDGTWIFAELIEWDETTIRASGKLLVIQEGALRVNAERVEMDRRTRFGTFYDAYGTARVTDREPEKNMFGSMEPEIMFRAEKIERIGPRTYRMTNGAFSTCVQPTPRWEMTGSSGTVTLDDKVVMTNVQLKVKRVPVLYVPYIYYPLKKEDRATGFLIPSYSASGVRGQGLSNAFFWVIGRSHDATLYYDWFSKSGQGGGADYRYVAAPGSQGNGRVYFMDQKERLRSDGSVELPASRWYEFRGSANQAVGRGFRLIGNVYYFTDQTSQLLYQQDMYSQSRRDRDLSAAVTGHAYGGRLRIDGLVQQRDIFNGATAARKSVLPQVDVRFTKRQPLAERVYVGAVGQVTYIDARPDPAQPQFDRSLWRLDATSRATAALSRLPYLPASAAASWRITHWSESLEPQTGVPTPVALTRNLLELRADLVGPLLERTFVTPENRYADKFKHVIEPRVSVQYYSPFDQLAQVIKIDPAIDQLVGGTASVAYSLTNRIKAKVRVDGGGTVQREIVMVRIDQTYYSDEQAGLVDPNYPTATVGTYSPVGMLVAVSPIEDVEGRFQMYVDSVAKAIRTYSASARIWRPRLQLDGGWSKRQYLPGVPGFDNPASASHYLNGNAAVRLLAGRLGASYGFNYNLRQNAFLQQRISGYYASQCCGISFDYQMMNISQFGLEGVQRDRRMAVTITLAGIGAFSTPLGAFGR